MLLGTAGCLVGRLDLAKDALTEARLLAEASGEELVESWTRLFAGLLTLGEADG